MAVKLSKLFFFVKPIKTIVLVPFGWIIVMLLVFAIPFLRPWWWIFAPLILASELRVLYLWWINWDYNYVETKWIILEIVPPKEVLVPLKAMEDVFTVMWGPLTSPNNWREVYCEGGLQVQPAWMSWEIASIEGNLHFYIRVKSDHRSTVETVLYSHYPELEIREVSDYTKHVPQNVPNDEWDVYGEDFILGTDDPFPMRTYEKFFEPAGEKIAAEEKRLDPIASLLELMSKLGPNEQFWLQFTITPLDDDDEKEFQNEAKKIIGKIVKRPVKKEVTFMQELLQVGYHLVMGPKKEGDDYKWLEISAAKSEDGERELLLTPGEREIVTEIENKIKKPVFRTGIRGVYVARRDHWKSSNKILTRSYFSHFQTQNMNYVRFTPTTRPKTQYVFRKRIPFIRARRQFRNYVNRFSPLFPERKQEMSIFSAEELATMYHFPFKITGLVAPTMARVESKKSGPPPNLPTE